MRGISIWSLCVGNESEIDAAFDRIYDSQSGVPVAGEAGQEVDAYGNTYSASSTTSASATIKVDTDRAERVVAAVQSGVEDEGRGGTDVDDVSGRRMGEGTICHADVETFLCQRIRELDEFGFGAPKEEEGQQQEKEERAMPQRYASGEAAKLLNVFRRWPSRPMPPLPQPVLPTPDQQQPPTNPLPQIVQW